MNVNTGNTNKLEVKSEKLEELNNNTQNNTENNSKKNLLERIKSIKTSKLRRFVLLAVILAFFFQFLKVKVLVGGLIGSVAFFFVKLIDIFAYAESLIASQAFTSSALIAVLPILGVYLVFGRAFCGWICPMDFLFELVDRLKKWKKSKLNIPPAVGYVIAAGFLIASFMTGIPIFSNYFSHLTNFFRAATGAVFLTLDLPVEPNVILFSATVIFILLSLEFISPRLWCKVLCPVGKTYGLLNKVSLLKLTFTDGECGECSLCENKCYMDVKLARHIDKPSLRDINCIYCGRCVEGCNAKGKLIKMKLWR